MGEHAHTIGKHAFELHCHLDRQRAQAVQDRVSSVFYGRLTAVMDQVLSAVLPMGQRMRLQRLELNLGTLRYNHLEEDLENRLRDALMEALRERLAALQHQQPHAGDELVPAQQSRLQVLAYFLEHGALPWWEQRNDFGSLDQLLEALIREEPTALNALIRDIGRSVVVRQRLVRQFSLRLIEALVKVLEPQHAAFIVSYVQDLKSLHREEPIVPASAEEFERSVWELVLAYIIEERGSVFNAKSFVKYNLRQIATRFVVDFGTLLNLLHEATTRQAVPPHLQTTLLDLIRLIREEHFREHGQAGPPAAVSPEGPVASQRPLLTYYLTFGSLPWWAPSWRERDVEALVKQWAATRPKDLAAIIREHVQDPDRLAMHAATTWSAETREHVLKALYPKLAPDISAWVGLVVAWQQARAGIGTAGAEPVWRAVWKLVLHPQDPVRKLKELVVRSIDHIVLPQMPGRSQWLQGDRPLANLRGMVVRELLEHAQVQGTSSRMQKTLSSLDQRASKPSWSAVLETTLHQVASRHASGRVADPLWSYGALTRWLLPLLQQLTPSDRLPGVLAKVQEVVRLQAREHGREAAQVWRQLRTWLLPLEGPVRYYAPFAQLRGALALYPDWSRLPGPEDGVGPDASTPDATTGSALKRALAPGASPEDAGARDQRVSESGAPYASEGEPISSSGAAGTGHEAAEAALESSLRQQTRPPVFDEQEVLWLLIHFQLFWQQNPDRQAALAYVQRVLRTVAGRYRL
ncbi:MAG: contractile injection system tape measure protein, partial [Bacteroidota bacterium]